MLTISMFYSCHLLLLSHLQPSKHPFHCFYHVSQPSRLSLLSLYVLLTSVQLVFDIVYICVYLCVCILSLTYTYITTVSLCIVLSVSPCSIVYLNVYKHSILHQYCVVTSIWIPREPLVWSLFNLK